MSIGMVKAGSVLAAMSMAVASPFATATSKNVSNSRPSISQLIDKALPGETVVGAFPAPPSGPGPGTLGVWQPNRGMIRTISFAPSGTTAGNSFYVATDHSTHTVFVPTAAGTTYVINTSTWKVMDHFTSPVGGRVAKVTPDGKLLILESASQTAAFRTTTPYKQVFSVSTGGNALVVTPNGRDAFVGGNADKKITEIALPTGRIVRTFPVGHSGDMVWARGQIFSANIATGVMSVVNPVTGKIVLISTPEVDPTFSYNDIPAATAGFMQLAVSPGQRRVYAAGFSGHILAFSTRRDMYLGEVSVNANTAGATNLLSGLAVLPGGRQAVVTVENLKRSVVVSLETGKILESADSLSSNRWVSFQ